MRYTPPITHDNEIDPIRRCVKRDKTGQSAGPAGRLPTMAHNQAVTAVTAVTGAAPRGVGAKGAYLQSE